MKAIGNRALQKKGLQATTFKHIHRKDFSIDLRGKDTWRYAKAGANPIVSISDEKIAVIQRKKMKNISLTELLTLAPDAQVFLLEGFSHLILKNKQIDALGKMAIIGALHGVATAHLHMIYNHAYNKDKESEGDTIKPPTENSINRIKDLLDKIDGGE